MHYVKNNVHVNGSYDTNTAATIIKENLPLYIEKNWDTIRILNDITAKIEDGTFNEMLFKQDLTQVYNCRGGFTDDEKEEIKSMVIDKVKNFLQNSKGDISRLEGLIKDFR